jgi:hypothetical protein
MRLIMAKTPDITTDIFGSILTITMANGAEFSVDTAKLSPEIQQQAMLHGLKQKLVDAAAIARNTTTGRSATIDDKAAAIREVHARITREDAPSWNKGREGGGNTSANGLLVRALMQMTGKDKAAIDEFLAAKSKEEKAALRKNPKVAAIIAELQTAASDVDSDALLDGLMNESEE